MPTSNPLRILFLVSAHNSLSQRIFIALTEQGHDVKVEVVSQGHEMEAAVAAHQPELIVCPFLKAFIPESIWKNNRCLVVHPGPQGDRGPSSLDWAVELGMDEWGITLLEADEEADAGDIWATRKFRTREVGKSSLYRHEVRRGAVQAVAEAMNNYGREGYTPTPLDYTDPNVTGRLRPLMKQADRAIDWGSDSTARVVRKIRAAEGHPGVLDTIEGVDFFLFGAHFERGLRGRPGQIIATRNGAICRATVDGAVWITHAKARDSFKLPATRALELEGVAFDAPELPVAVHAPIPAGHTFREIWYEERGQVGYLHFDFYNGAMSTEQCRRLRDAYRYAKARTQTKVIVLMGGEDFFSNGIHLNVIEAAENQGEESYYNLHAIDDIVQDILETESHIVVSALQGDAAAGGVPFAVAADHVVAREDVVFNPYYQHMGGLYGSEYWTYILPRRVGAEMSAGADVRAVQPDRHAPREGDRPDRRRLRRRPGELPYAPDRAWPSASRVTPTSRPGWPRRSAAAPPTRPSSRSRCTAPRRWRSRTTASSGPTAATTRRAAPSCGRPARPARCRSRPRPSPSSSPTRRRRPSRSWIARRTRC